MSEASEDFFFFTKDTFDWENIPDFVVGRVGWDSWLTQWALDHGVDVIDTTQLLHVSHLTGEVCSPCLARVHGSGRSLLRPPKALPYKLLRPPKALPYKLLRPPEARWCGGERTPQICDAGQAAALACDRNRRHTEMLGMGVVWRGAVRCRVVWCRAGWWRVVDAFVRVFMCSCVEEAGVSSGL